MSTYPTLKPAALSGSTLRIKIYHTFASNTHNRKMSQDPHNGKGAFEVHKQPKPGLKV